jgi:predicted small lipoprotein YifL
MLQEMLAIFCAARINSGGNIMKKVLAMLTLLALVLALAACGGGGGKSPSESSAPAESGKSQSVDGEMAKLKELYDGEWINEDPYDGPFTMEVLSTTSIKMTYEASGELICDLFYSSGEHTSISVSMSGNSLGKYSIDTQSGILTFRPNDTDVFTYTKE